MREEKTLKIRANHIGEDNVLLPAAADTCIAADQLQRFWAHGAPMGRGTYPYLLLQSCPAPSCRSTVAVIKPGYGQPWTLHLRNSEWSCSVSSFPVQQVSTISPCAAFTVAYSFECTTCIRILLAFQGRRSSKRYLRSPCKRMQSLYPVQRLQKTHILMALQPKRTTLRRKQPLI